MTNTETPPTREPSKVDGITGKIGIGLIVVVALIGLVVAGTSGSKSSGSSGGSGVELMAASTPTSVSVPSIGAESSLIETGQKSDGELEVPPLDNPMQASWYDKSPSPGTLGPSVILGHVNGYGKPGIFYRLKDTKAGDQILVRRQDGQTAVFTVSNIDTVPKAGFPAEQVYGDTPDAQLRLITCGGVFDPAAHSYEANVIVYANLTEVRPA
ncbi:class F sortase [Actinomycetospora termitidis]|uniref:Class F sortase n=1 Tax=Actinomycetospora termitidis TaxID=3053470 RepID=A0ABT7MHP6_9PSEU|nr:class F sortase [Actinomycetospora sp. Odt1-22]MDL5160208.1 class F sortase [Actinomycetospora sp. Odt1-22]